MILGCFYKFQAKKAIGFNEKKSAQRRLKPVPIKLHAGYQQKTKAVHLNGGELNSLSNVIAILSRTACAGISWNHF